MRHTVYHIQYKLTNRILSDSAVNLFSCLNRILKGLTMARNNHGVNFLLAGEQKALHHNNRYALSFGKQTYTLGIGLDQIWLQWFLWQGLNMLAMMIKMVTWYACDPSFKRHQICLQSGLQWGSYMLAISNPKRTIYACNLFQKGPNILVTKGTKCLSSCKQLGSYMLAMSKIVLNRPKSFLSAYKRVFFVIKMM